MPEFEFIEKGHIYKLNGTVIPSCTSVLPYFYHGNNEDAMTKGSYVHQMIELEAKGILDEETLHPDLKPYLEAYRLFRKQHELHGIYDIKSGSPHPCVELQLAGYSLLVNENGDKFEGDLLQAPVFEQRLYSPIYRFAGTPDIVALESIPCLNLKLYAVYLKSTGKYSLEKVRGNLRHNQQMFLAFLQTHKWRLSHGLLDKR